jgi:DNA polymerase III sliding clamp (beta) subunit (PCNA family)
VAAFREALETGPVRSGEAGADLSVLRVEDDGTVALCSDSDGDGVGAAHRVGVNRAYLLDALDALAAGTWDRLALEVSAPTAPIAIRRPDDEGAFSVLMPVRLED